ncbi:hypothetical protein D3C71_1927890 [compost metagenome]
MFDIALAGIELADLAFIDVNAEHTEADGVVTQHQRQAYIAETDDADYGFLAFEFCDAGFLVLGHKKNSGW